MLDYSFNSSESNTRILSKLQESILKQYRRLGFGQDTIQYSINSLNYEDLPRNFPEEFTQKNRKCLRLSSCGFFEMLTYSIFQFLLSNRTREKDETIKKIRKQITQKNFMQDSPSTKGLLIKGMKQMHDYVQLSKSHKPIAHCMWKNDSMLAFTQFWRALLAKLSIKNMVNAQTTKALDAGLFQLLADYLEVNFSIFYENQGYFENQVYSCRRKISCLKFNMVVFSNHKHKRNECSRILDSSVMTEKNSIIQSLEWSYIIVEDTAQYYRSQLQKQDISQIQQVDQSVVDEKQQLMRLFKCRAKSQISYQNALGNEYQNKELKSPINSEIKQKKCPQTTLTKKSVPTTDRKTATIMSLNMQILRKNSQETYQNLNVIQHSMILGNKLLCQMKQFCEKLRI